MTSVLRVTLFALWVLSGVFPASAQVAVPPDAALRQQAEQSLTGGDPATTIALAEQLLQRDPEDYQALVLLALAQIELGQQIEAAEAAGRAFRAGPADDQKLQAARIAAAARFNAGQYTQAEWWLRRASNHTRSEEETAQLRDEFQVVRQNNPISARLNFSISRSNNINGGAEDAFFFLDDFLFILGPASRALTGTEYSGEAELSYRFAQGADHASFLGLYLFGRTYTLSSASQATVPDVSGSDYALGVAEVSLTHRRLVFEGLGPTAVSVHTGRIWYGGDPLRRFNRLVVAQDIAMSESAAATVRALVEDQRSESELQPDTVVYDLQGTLARKLTNSDVMRFSLGYRLNDAEEETFTFDEYRGAIEYDFDDPVLGTDLTLSLGAGHKSFDEFSLSLDGRRDTYVSAGATAVFREFSYLGFSPSLSVSVIQTESNVSRFTNLDVQGALGISSRF